MLSLQGIAVSPGVAIGDAFVVDEEGFRIVRRSITADAVPEELERLRAAIDAAAHEIDANRRVVTEQLGEQYGAIFQAHRQMLNDPRLREELRRHIEHDHYSAEFAVAATLGRYAKVFDALPGPVVTERAHDIRDIERRLLRQLTGHHRQQLYQLRAPAVVLAHDLAPSETARLDPQFVLGFVTEAGGVGGHTAILAKAKEIPAVVGTGPFLTEVTVGDTVIVDGDHGRVVIRPDEATLGRYRSEAEHHRTVVGQFEQKAAEPACTADGTPLSVRANIEFPAEVEAARRRGADGIGLYRSEFLYLAADDEPTEEDHFRAYDEVARAMAPRPVIIRTLDLGADKLGRRCRGSDEPNPFLGLRSIRLSLRHPDEFRTQLRAVLRASAAGNVQVMFPMIATLEELRQARRVLQQAMDELEDRGQPFNRQIRVGIMVEVPSTVVMIERFLPEVDFISIGTNDLAQYTLAVDRANHEVAYLYQPTDPSVLALLQRTIEAADRHQIPVAACGQMSSHPGQALLLLGLGLRDFSVPPAGIAEIKAVLRKARLDECRDLAARALACNDARQVNQLLADELKRLDPQLASLI